jgi:hypothetical protein
MKALLRLCKAVFSVKALLRQAMHSFWKDSMLIYAGDKSVGFEYSLYSVVILAGTQFTSTLLVMQAKRVMALNEYSLYSVVILALALKTTSTTLVH